MSIRTFAKLAEIPATAWDALHDGCNPFVSHAFLAGLEAHGCLRADWGWSPLHLTLWDGDALIAAAPGYLKTNSHGEFVFDHAWARAYAHYGQDYYPKWLGAVPYSPVTGPRLLARDDEDRKRLLEAIAGFATQAGLSSAHVNFHEQGEDAAFGDDWLLREDVQYHWRNDAGWSSFDDFLAAMDHRHRKNIRQERRKVRDAGIAFRLVHGDEASEGDLAAMHGFYLRTFADYGNSPALTLDFLRHLARAMPRQLVIVLGERDGEPVSGALCLRGGGTLYGRYWGASEQVPGLHFETCYYQGIEHCIANGFAFKFLRSSQAHRLTNLKYATRGASGQVPTSRGFRPWKSLRKARRSIDRSAFAFTSALRVRPQSS